MDDVESFADFVVATQASLRRTAYLICGDWDLASDHVQEGLIKVYRHWHRLEDGPQAGPARRAYARKTVVNVAIDAGRRRSSREIVRAFGPGSGGVFEADRGRGSEVGTGGGSTDPTAEWHERETVLRALATVPSGRRACVVLRYYEDLSVAAVADILGISEGTVKSQTAKGLATIRAALEREAEAGGSHV